MTEYNPTQQRLKKRIVDVLQDKDGSAYTSVLRDELYSEFGYEEENKRSFQRQLLRIRPHLVDDDIIETEKEHTSSSRPEWRWTLA